MRITVLTPTYNRGGSIQKLYTSLDNQSIKDFEWLIVDDGLCADYTITELLRNSKNKLLTFVCIVPGKVLKARWSRKL